MDNPQLRYLFRRRMIKTIEATFMCFFFSLAVVRGEATHQQTLFEAGTLGYYSFRIPTIVRATDGTLLIFVEGRRNGWRDNEDIDIVLRRSEDGGRTWSSPYVVGDDGPNTFGNPVPIVNEQTGTIVLLSTHNLSEDRPPQIYDGTSRGTRTVWAQTSHDHGLTWSVAREITEQVKDDDWRWYATGPGHGIQLQRGSHVGRLVAGAAWNMGLGDDPGGAVLIYSDDDGQTWHRGDTLDRDGSFRPSESAVVELADGQICVNSRNGGFGRAVAYSRDGGASFQMRKVDETLFDPAVQGSILRAAARDLGDGTNLILFANPKNCDGENHQEERHHLTVRSSLDETKTWNVGKLIHRGPSSYSDMVRIEDNKIGLVFGHGHTSIYERVVFRSFTTDWLEDPTITQIDFRDRTARDQRGYGIHGRVEGTPWYVDGDSRYPGDKAVRFYGRHASVRIDDTQNHLLDFDGNDPFTIEVVFRTTNHLDNGFDEAGPLVAKDIMECGPSYWLTIQDGTLVFAIDNGRRVTAQSAEVVSDGDWHHAAAVVDRKKDKLRLYLDRKLVDVRSSLPTGSLANSSDLLIGAFNSSFVDDKRWFDGDISIVRISLESLEPVGFLQPKSSASYCKPEEMFSP